MRVLFFVLLLANLALFVLGNWFGPTTSGQVREELNTDKIRRLDPHDSPPSSSVDSLRYSISVIRLPPDSPACKKA